MMLMRWILVAAIWALARLGAKAIILPAPKDQGEGK